MQNFARPFKSIESSPARSAEAATVGARPHALRAYGQLMRPANVVTALADVLAGAAAAGLTNIQALPFLLLATAGLYAGGVVLNDVFDAKLDAIERPERPIPSGRVLLPNAAVLGVTLLAGGVSMAFLSSARSGVLALLIAVCAVLYDAWGKHQPILGPLNMGLCRGLNLLLGVSAVPLLLGQRWGLALIPIAYIAAITAVSRGEVHGGKRGAGLLALALLGAVILGALGLGATPAFSLLVALPFLALFAWRVLPPFWRAYQEPQPGPIRVAVRMGVLSLIVLDSAIAAGYAGVLFGGLVLALLLVAAGAKRSVVKCTA